MTSREQKKNLGHMYIVEFGDKGMVVGRSGSDEALLKNDLGSLLMKIGEMDEFGECDREDILLEVGGYHDKSRFFSGLAREKRPLSADESESLGNRERETFGSHRAEVFLVFVLVESECLVLSNQKKSAGCVVQCVFDVLARAVCMCI